MFPSFDNMKRTAINIILLSFFLLGCSSFASYSVESLNSNNDRGQIFAVKSHEICQNDNNALIGENPGMTGFDKGITVLPWNQSNERFIIDCSNGVASLARLYPGW